MKRLWMLASFLLAVPAMAAPPEGLDARIEAIRRESGSPGMAVAIVENGKIVTLRSKGGKRLAARQRMAYLKTFGFQSVDQRVRDRRFVFHQ